MFRIKPDALGRIEQEHWLAGLQVGIRPLRNSAFCLCGWEGRTDEYTRHLIDAIRVSRAELVVVPNGRVAVPSPFS